MQPFRKYCLLNGLDDIGLTLRHKDKIQAYEANRLATKPWLALRSDARGQPMSFCVEPVGFVHTARAPRAEDDHWGGQTAESRSPTA